jgi:hypothetical protein
MQQAPTYTPMAPDPRDRMRQQLAQAMMGQGMSTAPAAGPLAALARALQGALGAHMMNRADTGPAQMAQALSGQPAPAPAAPSPTPPGQARGRTVGAMFPGVDDYDEQSMVKMRREGTPVPNGEMGAQEQADLQAADIGYEDWPNLEIISREPDGSLRVRDKKTGRTGTWRP